MWNSGITSLAALYIVKGFGEVILISKYFFSYINWDKSSFSFKLSKSKVDHIHNIKTFIHAPYWIVVLIFLKLSKYNHCSNF